jgi:hypothetical protein
VPPPLARWAAALLAAAALLFWCYLRESQTAPVNSDGSGMALQGWDMLHGNLLLSGWWLADVTFYTFEVPVDALVEAIHGLNADVVHISAGVVYTLLVLTAALLARGSARGGEGVTRALLAAGIMVAPTLTPGARVLLLTPDHIGVGVPILLTLLLVDRARQRWWVPVAMAVLLIWAQVDDPLATYVAALPIALVCLIRGVLPLTRLRRPGWYDLSLTAAALVSVELTHLAVSAIKAAGGYVMQPLTGVAMVIPFGQWNHQMYITAQNLLILFGADFFDQPGGIQTVIAFAHFTGCTLAVAGLLIGLTTLVRRADRVTQILTVGIGATLAAGTFGVQTTVLFSAHEIAPALPFSAVLAGRTIGPWLAGRRLPRITLGPLLGVAFACYLAALGYNVSQPPAAAETQALADWLVAHHLTTGLGKYWSANSTTLASGAQVHVVSMQNRANFAYPWVTKPSWYDPTVSYANFVVAMPVPGGGVYAFDESDVRWAFGKPAIEYFYYPYVIMVYDKNLLSQVPPPDQSLIGALAPAG